MNIPFEAKLKNGLQDVDSLKTPDCLDTITIGFYAENNLSQEDKLKAENHLHSCLYCLKQLNDMKELLYYQEHKVTVSPNLLEKLKCVRLKHEEKVQGESLGEIFIAKIKNLLFFSTRQWRYAAVGLASACIAVLVSMHVMRPDSDFSHVPQINTNSFVNIKALSDDGKMLSEAQGVVVNSKGLIASNLEPLVGASYIQVTLKDGRTYQTKNIWKEEDKNLAVMKIDNESLPPIPTADINQISIGQNVFVVTDPSKAKKGFKESVISDFKQMPGRHKDSGVQYIQLATFTTKATKGALVDGQGKLIGFLMTEEKNINMVAPIADAERLAKQGKAIPLSELKHTKFSVEALNFYLKGILARDAQQWDQAMEFYKKALRLNPNLEGAHMELGYIYYRKHLYDLEAQEYEDVLKINPNSADALYGLGTNFETKGLFTEAIEKLEKAAALDPDDAETLSELGLAYLTIGRKDKAMALYPTLNALDPGSGEMLRRLSK